MVKIKESFILSTIITFFSIIKVYIDKKARTGDITYKHIKQTGDQLLLKTIGDVIKIGFKKRTLQN